MFDFSPLEGGVALNIKVPKSIDSKILPLLSDTDTLISMGGQKT